MREFLDRVDDLFEHDIRAAAGVPLHHLDEARLAEFFAGDVLAVGALFECQRRGWAVPGRIAIASFDDLDLLRHTVPTVTTLRIPPQDIGRRSAELLINRLRGASPQKVRIDVGFEIVQREST